MGGAETIQSNLPFDTINALLLTVPSLVCLLEYVHGAAVFYLIAVDA
jgi:hypothetical protein